MVPGLNMGLWGVNTLAMFDMVGAVRFLVSVPVQVFMCLVIRAIRSFVALTGADLRYGVRLGTGTVVPSSKLKLSQLGA